MVLLRFAPSPTGALHLGGLRTALYNFLYARKLGGKWILRIEDTDATRTVPGAVDGIREALEWAGLEYDYGPGKQGPHAPYFQSERLDLYRFYADKLLASGHAYRCFCSPDTIAATRERLARSGSNATYDKACLHVTEEEVVRRMKAGEKFVVRLNDGNLPSRPPPSDLIFRNLRDAHASLPTDPVLLKSDLFPTYHLASVVDDHEMGITHVLRGEEWLPSLPLHLDLYACLSLPPPQFAHLPLLLNPDGSKMSKRKGDVQVIDYKRRGWEQSAILNWLALAGWGVAHDAEASSDSTSPAKHAPDSTTVMTLDEMIKEFDLAAITHRRTVLDPMKLEYLNKHHLMRMMSTPEGLSNLAERVHIRVKEAFPHSQYTTVDSIKEVIAMLQGRIMNLNDLPSLASFLFIEPDYTTEEAQSMRQSLPSDKYNAVVVGLRDRLQLLAAPWQTVNFVDLLHEEHAKLGINQKQYMTIVRHALTGMKTGPGLGAVIGALGRERTIERLNRTLATQ
ncbi:glutamyl-tRNA synthetase [Laetiporus sulphureus 93-53]|uniref:Glutamate--tRNA ligase, mitochondrial n=1 Tax=Laetiporus sulphureus 93-53 TaxID=1314785 RepID=A0A165FJE8_9APHY|nr:glutamyl-tRNA synthetase [Laetiporus sulphureus 93-53]KZT09062.1 glutamyl-tRNA synthetase [Laetiporus sulphureus 93-53]